MVSSALCESKDTKERDRGWGSKGGKKEESASQKGGGIQKGEPSTY